MAKTLKDILEVAKPVSPADKAFVAKHTIKKTPDANKNGDDVFNATMTKTYKRGPHHGYDNGADEKVYEEHMTAADKAKEKAIKAKTDKSGMKASMIDQYGPEKGKQVYFATIRKQAMESVEETELDEASLKYAQVDPKDVKKVLAAHRATGESARHMGDGKIAYSGKKLVAESYEELDEGVSKDHYDLHHKRAMAALNDIGKHLMKQKTMCDKSDNKWIHSDQAWGMKDMARQLEDMAQGAAQRTENMTPVPTPSIRGY